MASTSGLSEYYLNTTIPLMGLEIGTMQGVGAENLLSKLPTLTLHGVDPYSEYKDWCGSVFHKDNKFKLEAQSRLEQFGSRFILHKKTSDDALNDFHDAYFDFIFIDGLHTYGQVLQDCRNYYPKLKTGGVCAGHDYGPQIPDVVKAVDQFASEVGKTVIPFHDNAWYWIK
jgi:predicted O-methyltransferase YrrM